MDQRLKVANDAVVNEQSLQGHLHMTSDFLSSIRLELSAIEDILNGPMLTGVVKEGVASNGYSMIGHAEEIKHDVSDVADRLRAIRIALAG